MTSAIVPFLLPLFRARADPVMEIWTWKWNVRVNCCSHNCCRSFRTSWETANLRCSLAMIRTRNDIRKQRSRYKAQKLQNKRQKWARKSTLISYVVSKFARLDTNVGGMADNRQLLYITKCKNRQLLGDYTIFIKPSHVRHKCGERKIEKNPGSN